MGERNLARTEWEQEGLRLRRTSLLLRTGLPTTTCGLGAGKKELEDRLAGGDVRHMENEVGFWKEQYRKAFVHSQELRREAKDAKTETCRIQKMVIATKTKKVVRTVTAKYGVVEKLKTDGTDRQSYSMRFRRNYSPTSRVIGGQSMSGQSGDRRCGRERTAESCPITNGITCRFTARRQEISPSAVSLRYKVIEGGVRRFVELRHAQRELVMLLAYTTWAKQQWWTQRTKKM